MKGATMNNESFTERMAEAVTNFRYRDFPDEVVSKTKYLVIDLLGCGIAGSVAPEATIIRDFVRETNSPAEATVWGSWEKSSDMNSAMANAYNSHILEMDDIVGAAFLHLGLPVIPAAIAMAEKYKKSGKQVIEAILAGYEAEERVGEALGASHYYFWHTTGTAGPFGAAAAAGRLIGLTADQMAEAFGSAGSQSAGLWQFLDDNAMTKYLHAAKAGYNGMLAALLAKKGLTGARKILEGEKGLLKATSKTQNPEKAFESLGSEYKLMSSEIKLWPSCGHTYSPIQACLNLKEKYGIDAKDIDKVDVETYLTATQVCKNNETFDSVRAVKFSISYCTSLALLFGKIEMGMFNRLVADPGVRALAAKTKVSAARDLDELYPPKKPARVTIRCGDKEFTETVDYAKGHPLNPLTGQEICDKYMGMTTDVIGREKAERLLDRLINLEKIEDIGTLFANL